MSDPRTIISVNLTHRLKQVARFNYKVQLKKKILTTLVFTTTRNKIFNKQRTGGFMLSNDVNLITSRLQNVHGSLVGASGHVRSVYLGL